MIKVQTYFPQHLDMFVDLSQPYEKIKFIQANYDKDDKSNIYGVFVADPVPGKQLAFEKKNLIDFVGPLFPAFSKYKTPRKDLLSYFHLCSKVSTLVIGYLIDQPGFRAEINALEEYLLTHKFTLSETQAALKSLLAYSTEYTFYKIKSKSYYCFSELKARQQSQIIYFKSIAEELRIKSNKISLLVSHGQTVGNYREVLLRDLIKKHLPEKFGIGTGFIQGLANQLDIIIFDAHNYAPLFREGDLIVVTQEAVRAIIEVKTTLTTTTLVESLEMFHKISLPGYKSTLLPIFKGIFTFDSKFKNTSSIAKNIYDFYNRPYFNQELQKNITRDILYLFHEITCVATLKKHVVFSKYSRAGEGESGNLIPSLYSVQDDKGMDIQTVIFMSLIFEYLDVEPYAKKASNWNISRQLVGTVNLKRNSN